MTMALRIAAVGVAVAGLIDPAVTVRRKAPLAIDVYHSSAPEAAALRDRLMADLGPDAIGGSGRAPASIVLIGVIPGDLTVPRGVAVSTMSLTSGDRHVRIVDVSQPQEVLPGQVAVVTAVLQGVNAAGTTSAISLEQDGVPVARVEHRWPAASGTFETQLRYAPPAAGVHRLRLVAREAAGAGAGTDDVADIALVSRARKLRILSYEPRPSWIARFVQTALESDPVFDVSSFVKSSRGLAVRTADPPRALTAAALGSFDAVTIGAPEELTAPEVAVLDAFARERGGAVILLPDRRPSGAYLDLVAAQKFDEVLLEEATAVDAGQPGALRASEFALPDRLGRGAVPVATIVHAGGPRASIVSWPRGAGRVLFAGALDAWRYRARDEDGFVRFWTGTIASLASAAPPVITLQVRPPIVAPRDRLLVRASIRATAFSRGTVPSIEAGLIAPDGSERMLRLWPAAETGVFEATLPAPAGGRYDVRASAAGAIADAPLQVDDGVRHPDDRDDDALRMVADATGGVAIRGRDLKPLEAHLRGLPRAETVVRIHPLRSPWWILAFAGALSVEWTARRRKGLA